MKDIDYDDIIRDGDTVQRISGSQNGMNTGDRGTVLGNMHMFCDRITIAKYRGLFTHEADRFKKVIRC